MYKKPLPIGVENFEKLLNEEYYYVDKTLLVKEVLDMKSDVNLFTRPRRFGKTLALSMLQYYFEDAYDRRGNKKDNSYLFEDMLIMKEGKRYTRHMGQYPVISLTLKSGKQSTFESCMSSLVSVLAREYSRHSFILKDNVLGEADTELYKAYMDRKKNPAEYKESLRFLCECLEAWYGKKVIILLDEYDVPLEGAYHYGFYNDMVDFIRGLFEAAFKTNNSLYFAVITGCLRISKESIFTGLNNLRINSILSKQFGEFFGFTEPEVMEMCRYYDMENKFEEMREWYNGYIFGDANVYNPWSCIQYAFDHRDGGDAFPEAYWVNTSSNSIVKDLIYRADADVRTTIEKLIAGGTITIPVHEDITYDEVYNSMDNLWNFMFFTGYFRKVDEYFVVPQRYVTLKIPDWEVNYIFREKVLSWFEEKVKEADRSVMTSALINGDTATFTKELRKMLESTISFNDYYENFYHGFLAGVLKGGFRDYAVKSNRECGNGRSDIFIRPMNPEKAVLVLELKVAKSLDGLEAAAKEAIQQIIDKEYEKEIFDEGYVKTKRFGVAFFKKTCLVVSG